jgi:branched-chain amino acid transport system ATP-binding protein
MSFLEVVNLEKKFLEFTAINNVSLGFEREKITALIGPNGAGKTTFLRLLSGELRPSNGKVVWKGKDITKHSFSRTALSGISRCFQIAYVFDSLSVMDNLRVAGRIKGFDKRTLDEKCEKLLEKVGMLEKKDTKVAFLPHGSRRMIELCMSFIQEPEVLLSDEIAAGLSGAEITGVAALLKEKSGECTIIIVEHRLEFVFGICHRVVVMHNGEILAEGSPEEIKNHEEVIRIYWGKS